MTADEKMYASLMDDVSNLRWKITQTEMFKALDQSVSRCIIYYTIIY